MNLTRALADICELDPPEILPEGTSDELATAAPELIRLGALVPAGVAREILCLDCDQPHGIFVEPDEAGDYRAYCMDTGWQRVSASTLQIYRINSAWIVTRIAAALGLDKPDFARDPSSVLDRIGLAQFGKFPCHLFFGRRLDDQIRLAAAAGDVTRVTSKIPAVIVTTTPLRLVPKLLPPKCGLVALGDILVIDGAKARVDVEPFLALLQGRRRDTTDALGFQFSVGFRSAVVAGVSYTFSNKQALVIEALYDAYKSGVHRVHFHELQGAADTPQNVGQLFKRHAAYGTLIQFDGQGYYWVDLDS